MFGSNSFLGVDLGAGGIKLVELKLEKKRPVLFTYGLTQEPQDVHWLAMGKKGASVSQGIVGKNLVSDVGSDLTADKNDLVFSDEKVAQYAGTLKAVCREARTVSKVAVVSLPVSAVFHAIVTLPLVKKEEFDQLLRTEMKKLLPYPLEEMSLDYQILVGNPEEKISRVLVNAVPRQLVVFYSKVFKAAGLKLDSLEPESLPLSRALVGRDLSVSMLVDMGAERTNFFIIDQMIPITHHSVELGGQKINKILAGILGINEPMVEQVKQDVFGRYFYADDQPMVKLESFLELFGGAVDPIVKEIDYAFDVYFRQTGNENKRPEKIILTGGAARLPYLANYLADKFKIKCYLGDPWGRVVYQDKLKPMLREIGPRMSVAIGLALRNMV